MGHPDEDLIPFHTYVLSNSDPHNKFYGQEKHLLYPQQTVQEFYDLEKRNSSKC